MCLSACVCVCVYACHRLIVASSFCRRPSESSSHCRSFFSSYFISPPFPHNITFRLLLSHPSFVSIGVDKRFAFFALRRRRRRQQQQPQHPQDRPASVGRLSLAQIGSLASYCPPVAPRLLSSPRIHHPQPLLPPHRHFTAHHVRQFVTPTQ